MGFKLDGLPSPAPGSHTAIEIDESPDSLLR